MGGLVVRLLGWAVVRFRALGFLEWIGIGSLVAQVADSEFVQKAEGMFSDAVYDWTAIRVEPSKIATAAGWSEGVSARLGFPIRDITDKEQTIKDVMQGAATIIANRSGVVLTDISSADAIKRDVMAYGVGRLAADAGIYLSDTLDLDAVKEDLKTWGMQQAMSRVSSDLSAQLDLVDGDGKRLVELLAEAGKNGIDPRALMKNANALLIGYAREEFARAEVITKKTRRRLQLRDAQAKFRRAHGNRQKYVPLGMVATFGDEVPAVPP